MPNYRMNKTIAGYHLLMILSAVDFRISGAEDMVIRQYLVDNFGFDDSALKTLGEGKQPDSTPDADWGSIKILIFPPGTEEPPDKPAPASASSATGQSARGVAAPNEKQ